MTGIEAVESLTLEGVLKTSLEEERTGLLTLHVNGSSTRAYMIDGCIVAVATDDPAYELGRFLVGAGALPLDKLAPVQRLGERSGKSMDEILLVAGTVDPEVLERCRCEHAAEILLNLDLHGALRCEFEPDELPDDVSGDLAVEIEVLLREQSRRAGRAGQLVPLLEQMDYRVVRTSVSGCPAGRDEPRVLTLVAGKRSVEELCVLSGLGHWRTLDALSGLHAQGLVCLRKPTDPEVEDWLEPRSELEDVFATQSIQPETMAEVCNEGPLTEGPAESEEEARRWLNLAEENLAAGIYDKCVLALQLAGQADPESRGVAGAIVEARQRLRDALRDREFPPGSRLQVASEGSSEKLEQHEAGIVHSLSCQPDVDALLAESALDEMDLLLTLKRLKDNGVLQPA